MYGKVHAEGKILPFSILLSIILHVLSMYLKDWLRGYYGDVSVTEVSPWYLCNVECLHCTASKPRTDCFIMDNWAHTQYGKKQWQSCFRPRSRSVK